MSPELRPVFVLIVVTAAAACFSVSTAGQDDYRPITITSVDSTDREVRITWENLLGGGVDFYVSYSSNGKAFDRQLAAKLDACEFTWKPDDLMLCGWVKVKGLRDGYLVGESTAPVSLAPRDGVVVSKADQKVLRFSSGNLADVFVCSTALPKYDLKEGRYRVYLREERHWSKEWEVWMPHSLFFHKGYALHATTMIRQLGRPASHGCIRLSPKDAERLYERVTVGTPVIVLPVSVDCDALLSRHAGDRARSAESPPTAKGRSLATVLGAPPSARPAQVQGGG